MPTIHVTIDKEGKTTVRGEGFTGMRCTQALDPLEKALGPQFGYRELHPGEPDVRNTQQVSQ